MTASVADCARPLPTRAYHGTPAQRHESISNLAATNVSTLRIGRDARLVAVAVVLAADERGAVEGFRRGEHLDLLVLQVAGLVADGRFHRQQRDDLQQVVLEHVADRSDGVVERATALDADRLGHRDLHAAHVAAVPDRFDQRVGEAEHEEVLDRLLAEVVVDAEDVLLGEHLVQHDVELVGGAEVTPEGLLDDDPSAFVEPDRRQ